MGFHFAVNTFSRLAFMLGSILTSFRRLLPHVPLSVFYWNSNEYDGGFSSNKKQINCNAIAFCNFK